MNSSIWEWPPHLALAFAIGAACVGAAWIAAWRQIQARNRRVEALREAVAASGMESTADAFSVTGEDVALLVSGERLAVLDLEVPKVAGTYSLGQVESLKIYDDRDHDAIDFHLALRGGARSRRIHTASMQEFCRLFEYLQKADKNVQFIAE